MRQIPPQMLDQPRIQKTTYAAVTYLFSVKIGFKILQLLYILLKNNISKTILRCVFLAFDQQPWSLSCYHPS